MSDTDQLVQLGLECWHDAPFADAPAIPNHMRMSIQRFLGDEESRAGWVLTEAGRIVGALAVSIFEHWMTAQRIAVQWWWWVQPEFRNGSGLAMLACAETWAKDRGANALHLLAPSSDFARLCERLGYNTVETTYAKELHP